MKKQYYSMKEITRITEANNREIDIIPTIIANASTEGVKLLQVKFKVFQRYIEIRLNDK